LNLFAVAKAVDLTESIGTVLEGVQLSQLNEAQLDELALLVSERGVVFFRNQDLTIEQQEKLFSHYGTSRACAIEIILTPPKAF
jgi:sulfonate dioxygenase